MVWIRIPDSMGSDSKNAVTGFGFHTFWNWIQIRNSDYKNAETGFLINKIQNTESVFSSQNSYPGCSKIGREKIEFSLYFLFLSTFQALFVVQIRYALFY